MTELPDWTLREVFLFDATMRLGSLTAAGADLRLGQSAASKLLANLEGKLGYALFDRQGRQLLPTDAAYRFHAHAREIIDVVHRAPEADANDRSLTVALPPTFAEGLVQAATRRLLLDVPDARIIIEVRNTPVVEELVAEGRVDLGITDGRVGNPNIRTVSFHRSLLSAFIPEHHPLSTKDRIFSTDLSGQTVVHLTRRHESRSHMERLFSKLTDPPVALAEASTAISAIHMAKELGAVAFTNAFPIAAFLPEGIRPRAFEESIPFVSRFLLTAWQSPSLLTKTFMTAVRRTADHLDGAERPTTAGVAR